LNDDYAYEYMQLYKCSYVHINMSVYQNTRMCKPCLRRHIYKSRVKLEMISLPAVKYL